MLARCLKQIVLDNIGSEAVPDYQLLWEGKYDNKAKRTWYSGYQDLTCCPFRIMYYVNEEGDQPTLGIKYTQDNKDLTYIVPTPDMDLEDIQVETVTGRGVYELHVAPGTDWVVINTRCYRDRGNNSDFEWI